MMIMVNKLKYTAILTIKFPIQQEKAKISLLMKDQTSKLKNVLLCVGIYYSGYQILYVFTTQISITSSVVRCQGILIHFLGCFNILIALDCVNCNWMTSIPIYICIQSHLILNCFWWTNPDKLLKNWMAATFNNRIFPPFPFSSACV